MRQGHLQARKTHPMPHSSLKTGVKNRHKSNDARIIATDNGIIALSYYSIIYTDGSVIDNKVEAAAVTLFNTTEGVAYDMRKVKLGDDVGKIECILLFSLKRHQL